MKNGIELPTEYPKTTCVAAGCQRWTRRFELETEYLCPSHWKAVPKRLRAVQVKAKRRLHKNPTAKEVTRNRRLWKKCVEMANAATFGLR